MQAGAHTVGEAQLQMWSLDEMTMYWRIGKSRVVHKDEAANDCHYVLRSVTEGEIIYKKPRNCSVCDECQRLEKKARAAARRKVK
jgi:hypothetical protein